MMKTISSTRFFKQTLSAALLAATACLSMQTQAQTITPVDQVDLQKYLGTWYEIARKPLSFQKDCAKTVKAEYSLNEKGTIQVNNSCITEDGKMKQSIGEAFVQNAPANSKLKVSFLPKVIRWLPLGRGDYWVLKLDPNYQTVLVGEPDKKYLWVLSRSTTPNPNEIEAYLKYAQSLGYDLNDLIRTPTQ